MEQMQQRPIILITMGDVAGIGPEIIVRAWQEDKLQQFCVPVVVGDAEVLVSTLVQMGIADKVIVIERPEAALSEDEGICCIQATEQDLQRVEPGKVSATAGQAAYDFLMKAIDFTREGQADAIVTTPLHKEGLHAAGYHYPGHTEILADRTGINQYGMMLYVERDQPSITKKTCFHGLGVAHVTLHMALRDVFAHIQPESILEKIGLLDKMLQQLLSKKPRLGVCGLNPHAGDGGLFGDEEQRLILPAVKQAQREGIEVSGPSPSDTLFRQAWEGKFDGIVAMYHDQGHIALKLLGGHRAVNITLGLPIIRTSVAHGTAYDIAGQGVADATSLLEAVRVAERLVHCLRVNRAIGV